MKKLLLSVLSLAFVFNANAQFANPGMEQWRNVPVVFNPAAGLEAPAGWFGIDSLLFENSPLLMFGLQATPKKMLFKSADAHSGAHAASIVSRNLGGSAGVLTGILTNAKVSVDFMNLDPDNPMAAISYTGGTPVNQRVSSITAWVKYLPNGNDHALMAATAVMTGAGANGQDSVVGIGGTAIAQSAAYTQVTMPMNYINANDVPDNLFISFMSSDMSDSAGVADNSTLFVDDVSFITVGISDLELTVSKVRIFPNPAAGHLNVSSEEKGSLKLEVFHLSGQKITEKSFRESTSLDVSGYAPGMYLYRIAGAEGALIQKGKFNVSR